MISGQLMILKLLLRTNQMLFTGSCLAHFVKHDSGEAWCHIFSSM
jgi:hypothetical protein